MTLALYGTRDAAGAHPSVCARAMPSDEVLSTPMRSAIMQDRVKRAREMYLPGTLVMAQATGDSELNGQTGFVEGVRDDHVIVALEQPWGRTILPLQQWVVVAIDEEFSELTRTGPSSHEQQPKQRQRPAAAARARPLRRAAARAAARARTRARTRAITRARTARPPTERLCPDAFASVCVY